MGVKNHGMCLYCRSRNHGTNDCNEKVKCPLCTTGWRQCFLVEKESPNKGFLFYTCTRHGINECNYWKLVGLPAKGHPDYEEGESSKANNLVEDFNEQDDVDDLSSKLEKCAEISEKMKVDVSLKVYEFTFRKRKD